MTKGNSCVGFYELYCRLEEMLFDTLLHATADDMLFIALFKRSCFLSSSSPLKSLTSSSCDERKIYIDVQYTCDFFAFSRTDNDCTSYIVCIWYSLWPVKPTQISLFSWKIVLFSLLCCPVQETLISLLRSQCQFYCDSKSSETLYLFDWNDDF